MLTGFLIISAPHVIKLELYNDGFKKISAVYILIYAHLILYKTSFLK